MVGVSGGWPDGLEWGLAESARKVVNMLGRSWEVLRGLEVKVKREVSRKGGG